MHRFSSKDTDLNHNIVETSSLKTPENRALEFVTQNQGQPLETATREMIEPKFGFDFSKVQIFADGQAPEHAHNLDARAFTIGQNMVFGTNQYQPNTREGQQLLTHELVHTVQQRNVDLKSIQNLEVADQNSSIEIQARASSANAMFGRGVQMPSSSSASIARETKDTTPDAGRAYISQEQENLHQENEKAAFEQAAAVLLQKHPNEIANWEHLTIDQRREVARTANEALNQAFTKAQGEKDPIHDPYPKPRPDAPNLGFDPNMKPGRFGENTNQGKNIALNDEMLKTASLDQMLDAIGHEFTHTQQFRQAASLSNYISPEHGRKMLINSWNYITPDENYASYQAQDMEVNARDGGYRFSNSMTKLTESNLQIERVKNLFKDTEIQVLTGALLQINGHQIINANELSLLSDHDLKTMLQISDKVRKLDPDSKLRFGEDGMIHVNGTEISARELETMTDKKLQTILKTSYKLNRKTEQDTPELIKNSSKNLVSTDNSENAQDTHSQPNPDLTLNHQVNSSVAAQSKTQKPVPEGGVEANKAAMNAGNMSFMNTRNPNWTWGLSEDGLTGTSTDGMTTRTQHADVNFQNGFGFNLGQSRVTETDKDHAMGSSHEFSLQNGEVGMGWGSSSRAKDADTGIVGSQSSSNKVGFGPNGFSGSRSNSQTTEVDGQKFTSGSSTGYSGGNFMYTSNNSIMSTDEHDNEITQSSSKTFNFGRDGMGGSASKTDVHGNTTSVNANLNAGLDSSGNLNNLQGSAGLSRNNKTVTVQAGYSVQASEPRQQGKNWLVDWSRTLNAGGKAGMSKGAANMGAGASVSDSEFGTRSFKTKEEAEAFQKDAAARLPIQSQNPNTAAGALQLEIGEVRGHGQSIDGSASAGMGFGGGGTIGGGISGGSSSSLSVRRVSANVFEVTDQSGGNKAANLTAGTLGSSASAYRKTDHGSSLTLSFDLSSQVGRDAFEAYNKNPSVVPNGAKQISSTQMQGENSGQNVSIIGAHSHNWDSRVEESVTQDQQGKLEQYAGTATETSSTNIPFFEKTHDNQSVSFQASERNDSNNQYALSGSVDSSSGSDSIRHLAVITSSAYRTDEGAISSGKWGVEVQITDEMIERFMEEIESEKIRKTDIFSGDDARNELREHLRDAKTSDDKKRALSRFFADEGHDGKAIKQMREVLTGGYKNSWSFGGDYESLKSNKLGNLEYDLTLPGDKNFKGMNARLELEGKIKHYQQIISTNPEAAGGLHSEIASLLEDVRRQSKEISDPKRYTDLPDELREHQVARLDGYIESLNTLRTQAGESIIETEAPKPDLDKKNPKVVTSNPGTLKRLGEDIAEWSGYIKSDQVDYKFYKSEFKELRQKQARQSLHLENGNSIFEKEIAAINIAEKAQKMSSHIDDLRAEYLQLRANPAQSGTAFAVGNALKSLLQEQSELWQDASMKMEEVRTLLENSIEAASEPQEKYVPTSMALPESKKPKRR